MYTSLYTRCDVLEKARIIFSRAVYMFTDSLKSFHRSSIKTCFPTINLSRKLALYTHRNTDYTRGSFISVFRMCVQIIDGLICPQLLQECSFVHNYYRNVHNYSRTQQSTEAMMRHKNTFSELSKFKNNSCFYCFLRSGKLRKIHILNRVSESPKIRKKLHPFQADKLLVSRVS